MTESQLARTMTPKGLERTSTPRGAGSQRVKRIIKSDSSKDPGPDDGDDDDDGGIDLDWPKGLVNQIYYVLLCPIMFGLAYSIPNCRRRNTCGGGVHRSILYIGFFSYFMVWWATSIGAVVGISDEVMGYTFFGGGNVCAGPDVVGHRRQAGLWRHGE